MPTLLLIYLAPVSMSHPDYESRRNEAYLVPGINQTTLLSLDCWAGGNFIILLKCVTQLDTT